MNKPKWADMVEKADWNDNGCKRLTFQAFTPKAERDLAKYEPRIVSLMEKWFRD